MQNPLAIELNRESWSSRRQLSGWQSRPVEVGEGEVDTEVGVADTEVVIDTEVGVFDAEVGVIDSGEAIKHEQAELTALGLPAQSPR